MADVLEPKQLNTYFALMEAVSLLQHAVSQQLRAEGGLSYVQFELLARLSSSDGPLTMTELADGVVYSRSGLTHQAGLLEKAGLVTRGPSADDHRATVVGITEAGRELVAKVLPGHVDAVHAAAVRPTVHFGPGRAGRHHGPRPRPHARRTAAVGRDAEEPEGERRLVRLL